MQDDWSTLSLEELRDRWRAAWPEALACWSRFTKLSEPRWCFEPEEEEREGLTRSFAMIRLVDQAVVISLRQVREKEIEPFGREILAHEVGHHIYAPATLLDQGRALARMRRSLPTCERHAPLVANLYQDLLINTRLQRTHGLGMAEVFRRLRTDEEMHPLGRLYMRIYEILWSLRRGSLAVGEIPSTMEGDAVLGARLVRSYGSEWLDGAGRFAALCLPYLLEEEVEGRVRTLVIWRDTEGAGAGACEAPAGLAALDPGEEEGALHPAQDPALSGLDHPGRPLDLTGPPRDTTGGAGSPGQYREPFEYGALLKALGLDLSDHEIAVRYYRERAIPHLVPFPRDPTPPAMDPLPEGIERWDIGQPLERLDPLETVLASPVVVPGLTTVMRSWGVETGSDPDPTPVDLDLYVDCSGSMPDPQRFVSYLTLAGAVVALSALRAGARVQATLWSGANQFQSTPGFVRNGPEVLRVLTGYLGGGTAFPLHVLRETYARRRPRDRRVHILVVSDDGVTTMFDADEKGNSGWDLSRKALEAARGGGTMVLHLFQDPQHDPRLRRAMEEGWEIHRVTCWEELVGFARGFARKAWPARDRSRPAGGPLPPR